MNCKDIDILIIDLANGNLTENKAKLLMEHIRTCESCEINYMQIKTVLKDLNSPSYHVPTDRLKQDFYDSLENVKAIQNKKISSPIHKIKYSWMYQVAAAVVFILLGYTFGSHKIDSKSQEQFKISQQTIALKEQVMMAMIDNQSPSKRIQAVTYSESFEKPNTKILEALIDRLKFDSNINVRLAAARALMKFPESDLVINTFIKILAEEKNPGLQINIIEFLVKIEENKALPELYQLLNQPETPEFIKQQIIAGIEEII